MGEIGRKIWIIGLNASNAFEYQPSISPAGTPTATASANPIDTRNSDATMYLKMTPCRVSSTMPRATSDGFGNIVLPDQRTATSQTIRNTTATPSGRR